MRATLFESEQKVMECLWEKGDCQAAELVLILEERVGWKRNTTYTVIKKLVDKGFIQRLKPKFLCRARISREEVVKAHTGDLVGKFFSGSNMMFLSEFVRNQDLTKDEIAELRTLIKKLS